MSDIVFRGTPLCTLSNASLISIASTEVARTRLWFMSAQLINSASAPAVEKPLHPPDYGFGMVSAVSDANLLCTTFLSTFPKQLSNLIRRQDLTSVSFLTSLCFFVALIAQICFRVPLINLGFVLQIFCPLKWTFTINLTSLYLAGIQNITLLGMQYRQRNCLLLFFFICQRKAVNESVDRNYVVQGLQKAKPTTQYCFFVKSSENSRICNHTLI